jgi:hypothetical protein
VAGRRTPPRRNVTAFSLAFLDIMSCGLGAVILVFLLIKHADQNSPRNLGVVAQDIETQEQENDLLKEILDSLQVQFNSSDRDLRSLRNQLDAAAVQTQNMEQKSAALRAEAENTRAKLTEAQQQASDAAADVENEGNRNYLIGLKIEGKRVAFLLDSSASMLATDIVDIVRLKNSSPSRKASAPKWVWGKKILQWMVARLPAESEARVMTFNRDVTDHSAGGSWTQARDSSGISATLSSALSVAPANGTNLERAIEAIANLRPAPDALYLITDGLPTLHGDIRTFDLDRITSCFRSKRNTVSPKCRAEFFARADKKLFSRLPTLKVNVVLLPIEGDPASALAFWIMANRNNGMLLTPNENWP